MNWNRRENCLQNRTTAPTLSFILVKYFRKIKTKKKQKKVGFFQLFSTPEGGDYLKEEGLLSLDLKVLEFLESFLVLDLKGCCPLYSS